MSEMIVFMAAPVAACVVLLLMCGYLGQHVLKREILFIDIALAQIASLGATIALVLDIGMHSGQAHLFSLLAVAGASALFAATRYGCRVVPQEAVIGITYAVASMTALLLIDQAAGGHEHVSEMLAGSILWVGWKDVASTAAVFALVGLVHRLFRGRFSRLSRDYDRARQEGMRVRLWDFLFYFSFGAAMVYAVQIAGILLVFAYLIIPTTVSALVAARWSARIAVAWIVGTVASLAGLYISWTFDLQCGPTLVCILGVFLVMAAILTRAGLLPRAAGAITDIPQRMS